MSTPDQSIDTTAAEAYEKYMVPGMFLHWAEMLVRIAAPRPDEHVLDVACGTGIGARLVAEVLGGRGKVAGLDIDGGVIEVARRTAGRCAMQIEWHCASALSMPFDAASFDLCLCFQGLQFLPDRAAGLAELRRILKPTGRLVASIWGPLEANAGHCAVVAALERQGVDAAPAKRACSFSDPEEIRAAAALAGFTRIEIKTEDGTSRFESIATFLDGMTIGSPSTRLAVARLPEAGRVVFARDVSAALEPYARNGRLEYPMRTHILVARS
jgi:SAM-dependent methyltransferase